MKRYNGHEAAYQQNQEYLHSVIRQEVVQNLKGLSD